MSATTKNAATKTAKTRTAKSATKAPEPPPVTVSVAEESANGSTQVIKSGEFIRVWNASGSSREVALHFGKGAESKGIGWANNRAISLRKQLGDNPEEGGVKVMPRLAGGGSRLDKDALREEAKRGYQEFLARQKAEEAAAKTEPAKK